MDAAQSRRLHTRLAVALLVVVLALAAVAVSACGEALVEKAIEKAAQQSGQDADADVDIDSGGASVSVSGENGEMAWQVGEGVDVPEGFPTALIPGGAKIVQAITSAENGSQTQVVSFESSMSDKDMYDYCLEALPRLGYEITDKVRMESGEGANITVQGEGPDGTVAISGGGKTGDGYYYMMYYYTIGVEP